MRITTLSLLALSACASAPPPTPQESLDRIIAGVEKAPALRIRFGGQETSGGKSRSFSGSLSLKSGNRASIRLSGELDEGILETTCDGSSIVLRAKGRLGTPAKAHARHESELRTAAARLSCLLLAEVAREAARGQAVFENEPLVVKDVKGGPEEGGLQVITYSVAIRQLPPMTVKLWLDPRSGLPRRRMSEWTEGATTMSVDERFEEWNVAADLADADFAIPTK